MPAAGIILAAAQAEAVRAFFINVQVKWNARFAQGVGEAQTILDHFVWNETPVLSGHLQALVPPWGDETSEPPYEFFPTLDVEGDLSLRLLSAASIPFESLASAVSLRHGVVRLPNLVLERPEGGLRVGAQADLISNVFEANISSRIDPAIFQPLAPAEAQDDEG